jgi:hypothetical protein
LRQLHGLRDTGIPDDHLVDGLNAPASHAATHRTEANDGDFRHRNLRPPRTAWPPGMRAFGLDLAVLRRSGRQQLREQPLRRRSDVVDRAGERFLVRCDGFEQPLILLTYWSDASRISSFVADGSGV